MKRIQSVTKRLILPKKSEMDKLMEAKSGVVVVEMKGRLNWESLIKGL